MVKDSQNTTPTPKSFFTTKEAAFYLGIALPTLYSYTSRRIIPHYKTRRKIYFKVEDLDNYVMNSDNRIKSDEEISQEAIRYETQRRK